MWRVRRIVSFLGTSLVAAAACTVPDVPPSATGGGFAGGSFPGKTGTAGDSNFCKMVSQGFGGLTFGGSTSVGGNATSAGGAFVIVSGGGGSAGSSSGGTGGTGGTGLAGGTGGIGEVAGAAGGGGVGGQDSTTAGAGADDSVGGSASGGAPPSSSGAAGAEAGGVSSAGSAAEGAASGVGAQAAPWGDGGSGGFGGDGGRDGASIIVRDPSSTKPVASGGAPGVDPSKACPDRVPDGAPTARVSCEQEVTCDFINGSVCACMPCADGQGLCWQCVVMEQPFGCPSEPPAPDEPCDWAGRVCKYGDCSRWNALEAGCCLGKWRVQLNCVARPGGQ